MSPHSWFSPACTSLKLVGCMLVAAMSLIGANAAAATYNLIELATLTQGGTVVVRGPNNAGVAVGAGTLLGSGQPRGLLFATGTPARQITGLAGGDDSAIVFGVNDAGGFVGSSNTATALRAFAGTQAGGTRELAPLAGDNASAAYALNNLGQAVGLSSGPGGERAVIWDANGTPTALPVSSGVSGSRATAINERGDVAGVSGTAATRRATLWPFGQAARQLVLLAGHTTSEASDVNARGDIIGYSASASGARRAALWPSGGAAVDLGTLPGGNFSDAFGINDAGDVVGTSSSNAGVRAFLWTPGSGLQDLNSLIAPSPFVLTGAVGINNVGMIIATGYEAAAAHELTGHADEIHELPVRVFLLTR